MEKKVKKKLFSFLATARQLALLNCIKTGNGGEKNGYPG